MKKFHLGNLFRWVTYGAAILLALVGLLHFLLPYVVNTSSIQKRIMAGISNALPGDVNYGSIEPALFPKPRVIINQGTYTDPGALSIRITKGFLKPKFWALFAGKLELDTLRIDRADISVVLTPLGQPAPQPRELVQFREINNLVVGALSVMPDHFNNAKVDIDNGRLTVVRNGQMLIDLFQVDLSLNRAANQLNLYLEGASNFTRRIEVQGQFDLSKFAGHVDLQLNKLMTEQIQANAGIADGLGFPISNLDVALQLDIQTQGAWDLQYRIDAPDMRIDNGARHLLLKGFLMEGDARWTADRLDTHITQLQLASPHVLLTGGLNLATSDDPTDSAIELTLQSRELNVSHIRAALLELVGNVSEIQTTFGIVQGGDLSSLTASCTAPSWEAFKKLGNLKVTARLRNGRIQVPNELMLLNDVQGKIAWSKGRLLGENISASFGKTTAKKGSLEIGLADGSKAFELTTDVSAHLAQLPGILKKLMGDRTDLIKLASWPPLSGRATGQLILGNRLDRIRASVITNANLKFLDASVTLSGSVNNLPTAKTRVNLNTKGKLGPQSQILLANYFKVPEQLVPQTALTIRKAEVTRDPNGTVDISSDITATNDVSLSSQVQIQTEGVRFEKLHIKDAVSDARISFLRPDKAAPWDITFNGILAKSTVDKLYRQEFVKQGLIKGNLQAKVDVQTPSLSNLQGTVEASDLDLHSKVYGTVRITDSRLIAESNQLTIPTADIQWHDHSIKLVGEATLSPEIIDMDITLTADELNVDEIMQVIEQKSSLSSTEQIAPKALPKLIGNVAVKIDDLALGGYRYVPLQAIIELKPDQTIVDVTEAKVCGIDVPGQIKIANDNAVLKFKPKAKQKILEHTSSCLTNTSNTERYEGVIDIRGEVTTQGFNRRELIANLKGHADIRIQDGRVYNIGAAGFFTNVLSYLSLNQLLKGDMPDLSKSDFQYKSIESKLKLKDGLLHVEEGVLKSNSINLVAEGKYNLMSDDLKLNVLVSPLTSLDWVIERIPIINTILKGTLVAIPVGVKGAATNPTIVPLSLTSVGSRVGGILKRTLETPIRIVEPILPKKKDTEKKSGGTPDMDPEVSPEP